MNDVVRLFFRRLGEDSSKAVDLVCEIVSVETFVMMKNGNGIPLRHRGLAAFSSAKSQVVFNVHETVNTLHSRFIPQDQSNKQI